MRIRGCITTRLSAADHGADCEDGSGWGGFDELEVLVSGKKAGAKAPDFGDDLS
jgi:hypothetical protein